MQTIFQIQLQFTAGVVLLLLCRPLLNRFPKIVPYCLWCILFLRLLCPFSLATDFAVWPVQDHAETAEQVERQQMGKDPETVDEIITGGVQQTDTEVMVDGNGQNRAENVAGDVSRTGAENSIDYWLDTHIILFVGIWAAGMALYLTYALYAVCKYRHYVKGADVCPGRQQVYESSQITTPFVFGILHKKIILPQGLSDAEREYILCHEEMHIRRNDHLVKWIVFLLTGIYWFQPMVWVAAHYLEQDMEMSCDEMVIRNMGDGIRKVYAQSLLSFAKGRRQEILPPAFASGGVKQRIQNVLQAKRFRKWMIPVSVVLVISFVAILFTEQREQAEQNDGQGRPDIQQTAEMTSAEASDTPVDKMISDVVEDDKTSEDQISTQDNPSPPKQYVYKEDVTHDGIKDIITLDMTALYDESLATGEEETITVTSGKTGKKIASYTADTVHYGWNGLYLYEGQEGKYLVNWKPAMYQGLGAFQFRVFSLKEDGKEDVLIEKEFRFDLNPGKINFDKKAYQEYIDLVNDYLSKSYVIVDTDQGKVMYSTKEKQLRASYDGSWVIDDYQELKVTE